MLMTWSFDALRRVPGPLGITGVSCPLLRHKDGGIRPSSYVTVFYVQVDPNKKAFIPCRYTRELFFFSGTIKVPVNVFGSRVQWCVYRVNMFRNYPDDTTSGQHFLLILRLFILISTSFTVPEIG